MRQLNPSTNLILAVLAGLGLLAALTLPWFAAPGTSPNENDGPIERGAWQVAQVFATSAKGTVSGNDAVGDSRMLLVVAVVIVGLLALAIAANVGRRGAEDLMRAVAIALPVLVAGLAIAHPGTSAPVRIHYGLLAAMAIALFAASAAWHGAAWREKHAAPVRPRYGR